MPEPAVPGAAPPQAAAGPGSERDAPEQALPGKPRARLLLLVAGFVLALDIASKCLVVAELEGRRVVSLFGGHLLLRVIRNSGAAFSFAEGKTVLFTVVAVGVAVYILRTARRLRSAAWAVTLGLLLGGALGNLVDRLLRSPGIGRGAVVDFVDLRWWPVFNLADSAISVGAVLAVVLSLRGTDVEGRRRTS